MKNSNRSTKVVSCADVIRALEAAGIVVPPHSTRIVITLEYGELPRIESDGRMAVLTERDL